MFVDVDAVDVSIVVRIVRAVVQYTRRLVCVIVLVGGYNSIRPIAQHGMPSGDMVMWYNPEHHFVRPGTSH